MTALSLKNVNKSFGSVHVLKDIDLEVEDGEFVVFVGPSGCGKSTLLRVIAGLEDATTGTVEIAGEEGEHRPPRQARHCDGVPKLCALPASVGAWQHGAWPEAGRPAQAGDRGSRGRGRPDAVARRVSGSPPFGTVGRSATEGRHRPGRGAPAQAVPVRRTAIQPRRCVADEHAGGNRPPAPDIGCLDDLRHPRPDRSDDAGRQDRRSSRWSGGTGRQPDGVV